MDHSQSRRRASRATRVLRVRKSLKGSAEQPRLSVSKTNAHIYVQLINDQQGVTLGGVGTLSKTSRVAGYPRKSKESARHLGAEIAKIAKQQNIDRVIFDRGPCKYHGIIAELAQAARAAGLQF